MERRHTARITPCRRKQRRATQHCGLRWHLRVAAPCAWTHVFCNHGHPARNTQECRASACDPTVGWFSPPTLSWGSSHVPVRVGASKVSGKGGMVLTYGPLHLFGILLRIYCSMQTPAYAHASPLAGHDASSGVALPVRLPKTPPRCA